MPTQGVSIALTPTALLRRLPRAAGVFLLDGGAADSWGGNEALLGSEPTLVATYTADGRAALISSDRREQSVDDPFVVLDRLARMTPSPPAGESPMSGVICALGYDLGRWVERLPDSPADDLDLPVLFAALHPWVLAYSYRERRYQLRSALLSAGELRDVARRLEAAGRNPAPPADESGGSPFTPNLSRRAYEDAVRRALEYIVAGDIYQVNLAQRFSAQRHLVPAALCETWVRQHPAPFAGYIDCGAFALVSNSPECFLRRDGSQVATFPIKGTRPRGTTPERDRAQADELTASAKDRAEHVMIVDLERNDLGRVCVPGTVQVRQLAALRSYPTLHHLESTISGTLRPNVGTADLLRATFPGGSISGAPKIRAMQIIDELEPAARRFYTGAMGFVAGESWARLNVAIRTATLTANAIHYHAGGGIVADSTPEREYEECLLKAQGFFTAVGAQ